LIESEYLQNRQNDYLKLSYACTLLRSAQENNKKNAVRLLHGKTEKEDESENKTLDH